MSSTSAKPANRRRSSSVTDALRQIPLNHQDNARNSPAKASSGIKPLSGKARPAKKADANDLPLEYRSRGLFNDLTTGRWMLVPSSALVLLLIPVILHVNFTALVHSGVLAKNTPNPFKALLMPLGKLPNGKYAKVWTDSVFCAYYIIFWSFVRQSVTIYILRPMAKALGIKGNKIMRFTEQGYAIFYFGILGSLGVYVMHGLPTWWYKTEYFWSTYPQDQMTFELKTYYLIQAAYWLQQTIILAAKIEKPRKDFKELVAHHMVTLWLIWWSYQTYLTYIGVAIFVTMDVSDVFLALAKCVNYVDETASIPIFAFFVGVWTYFRHYLNIRILYSVYAEYSLIPKEYQNNFNPLEDKWMTWWIQPNIFAPIFLLQCINLFWYVLILRILVRAVFTATASDDRSDDEDEGDEAAEEPSTAEKVKALKGEKAE